jgi:hypothetical protein
MSVTDPTADASSDAAGDRSVTVHLRAAPSAAAGRRQRAVLDRLRALEADGTVADLTARRWSSRVTVPVAEPDADEASAVDLYAEFEALAAESTLQLEPFFEKRHRTGGLLSGGPPTEREVVFPVVCVTVRRDETLVGLYPCWRDGEHHAVEDGLDALADGESGANLVDD